MIEAKIKRIDKSLSLPIYETNGSVGFDLLAREDVVIEAGEIALVPANVIIETPEGWMLIIVPRSSTPKRKCLAFPHSIGIIDNDFCGEEDELLLQVLNFSKEKSFVRRGEKIAQGIFVKVEKVIWQEKEQMDEKSRGGYGSTDRK